MAKSTRKQALRQLLSPASLFWLFGHFILILSGMLLWVWGDVPSQISLKAIWQALGGSLLASGVAGEVLFLYVWSSDSTRGKIDIITRAGLDSIFPFRSVQIKHEYDRRLENARQIDVIGFGLSSLREDYGHQFATWSRKAKVRILVIDPDFPNSRNSYADQRDREERNHRGKIKKDVAALIALVQGIEGLAHDRFQIRLLRTLPSINMFRIDDEVFWGPYLALQQSRNTPTLLAKGGFLFERLTEHFDALWGDEEFSTQAFPTKPAEQD